MHRAAGRRLRIAWLGNVECWLVRRALRFGTAVGDAIKGLLNDTEDAEHLSKVAELVVSTGTGSELTEAVTALVQSGDRPPTS